MTFHAGPLSVDFCQGELRDVRWGEREVLRRVYFAVRDPFWNTVPSEIVALKFQPGSDQLLLSFLAVHQQGEIDFQWHGYIRGDTQGAITFTMDGAAHREFQRNRIGLCILHPPDCAGQSCRIEHADGSITEGQFPCFLQPYEIVTLDTP
jgi:hypothetical protein